MNNFDINLLNDEQRLPLLQTKGAVLVTAGAGSGKTRLLTHRIAYLLSQGVSAYSILAITFTNKATREMAERVRNMCDEGGNIWISTFHSMCVKILRQHIDRLGYSRYFTIYDEDDSEKVVKDSLSAFSLPEDKYKKTVLFHISNWKNTVMSLAEYEEACKDVTDIKKIVKVIDEYQKTLQKNNALDFDDLLIKTYKLFLQCEDVKNLYAQRFEYILVDEFQDTNIVQYELLKQLASVHGNIFVVGDEDQCIYSWRGANFKNIFNFRKDFPDVKVYKLERNYRSTSKILDRANKLIAHNASRLEKKLWTQKEGGDEPVIYNAIDERDEALFVASTIERLMRRGDKPSDFAVLMRLNALSRNLEEALLSYNIPYKIYGGESSVEKLKTLAGNDSILRALLAGKMQSDAALEKKLASFLEIFSALKNLDIPLADFAGEVITKFGLRDAYDKKSEDGFDRLMNISSFEAGVREYARLNPNASLADFLESITLSSDADEIGEGGSVTIATVHAVKGLEFKNVFIIGLEEGIFPISRATMPDDVEEERRLMYVAVTRAEEKVIITHCSKRFLYGKTNYQIASRFCKELGFYQFSPKKIEQRNVMSEGKSFAQNTSFFNKNSILTRFEEKNDKIDTSKYKCGQIVAHPKFGKGKIESITDDRLVGDIIFESVGKKSLMLEIAPLTILGEE